jgi:hypothetical protein
MSRLLLKARPTVEQLADRLRPPRPDGLELYLDRVDLIDQAAMDRVVANVEACDLPSDFSLLIEGPVGSLDGEFFDLTRESAADRELIRRLAELTRRLRAGAVNVHVIAPTSDQASLSLAAQRDGLERSLPLTRFFVDQIGRAGATPTVENMPPILRMRQGGFFFSPIGLAAEDLVWLCERVPGLRATLDLSHTGLYVNCKLAAEQGSAAAADYGALFDFARALPAAPSVEQYAAALGPHLLTCHVANAAGLLGEGEPYDQGDLDLDHLVATLAPRTAYFVTETLEADHDRAIEMRRALQAMRLTLRAVA